MKILKEIWNGYFSQLSGFEITIYLIAFGYISGFSIAVSLYNFWAKPPLNRNLPREQRQDQYRQLYPIHQLPRQAEPEGRKETRPSERQEKNRHTYFGDRRR